MISVLVDWYKDPTNFNNWPSALDTLTAYPAGSNTMRMAGNTNSTQEQS